MICLFLFVICAMFSDCWFEQMDRGRKGQEKDGEEIEMKEFIFLCVVAVDDFFYSTLLGLYDFFVSSF